MGKKTHEPLSAPPARERLRAFLTRNPKATAAAAARALGVSRQRIHQIADEEGIELEKYSMPYQTPEEFLGSAGGGIVTVSSNIDEVTGHGTRAHRLAVLRVAGDLVALGFDVYFPFNRLEGAADLVTVDPDTFTCERVVVDLSATRSIVEDPNRPEIAGRRVAIVSNDSSGIQYAPAFQSPRSKPKQSGIANVGR